MSFEFFCKCISGQWWSPQVDGEAVPSCRASHGKVPPTDRGPCAWHDECPAVCRPQLPPADDRRDRGAQVSSRLTSTKQVRCGVNLLTKINMLQLKQTSTWKILITQQDTHQTHLQKYSLIFFYLTKWLSIILVAKMKKSNQNNTVCIITIHHCIQSCYLIITAFNIFVCSVNIFVTLFHLHLITEWIL